MFLRKLLLLISFLFLNQFTHANSTKVVLSCETQNSSCEDSRKQCNILCELPATVKFDDLLEIEQVVGISNNEIKSTMSSLTIKSTQMTGKLAENIGNTVANFPSFQKFSITHSKLKSIKQLDFVYMKIITELDLSNNQIDMLPNGVFDNLTQLEILSIHDNKISFLPAGLLVMLTRLKDFYAQFNQIEEVNANFVGNNNVIERILLQNNKIMKVVERFNRLTHLRLVNLRGNSEFCVCKVIDQNERKSTKNECENDKLKVEVEWKMKFINCSMIKATELNTVTVGPCALNQAIRMNKEQLQFEICVNDYEEDRKTEAIQSCTVPRLNEEQDIWSEFDECVSEKAELNSQLNQLLQSCYKDRNLRINETTVKFNSCMLCTKIRYIKDNGDDIDYFQEEVLSYFGND